MEKITWEQMLEILTMLFKTLFKLFFSEKVQWDVPRGTAQGIIKGNSESFANQFVKFLANGGRVLLGDLKVATVSFDIHAFLGKDWEYWKGPLDGDGLEGEPAGDNRSAVLQEADFAQSDFLTCLEERETTIKGTEKYARLKKSCQTLYGVTVFMGLWLDYQARGTESVLEKLFKEEGITCLDFFGDILRDPNGRCCVLYFYRDADGRWHWSYDWLGLAWGGRSFSAASQQVSE